MSLDGYTTTTTRTNAESILTDLTWDNVHERHVSSLEDALAYFISADHRRDLLYFKRTANGGPYDVERISAKLVSPETEHYVLSATTLMHVMPGQQSEIIPIKEWIYESRMYGQLVCGFPIFRGFRKRRIFQCWRRNVGIKIYMDIRRTLASKLIYARPHMCEPVLDALSVARSIGCARPLSISNASSQLITFSSLATARSRNMASLEEALENEYDGNFYDLPVDLEDEEVAVMHIHYFLDEEVAVMHIH